MWVLIVNPSSGGGKGKRVADQVIALLRSRSIEFIAVVENSEKATKEQLATVLAERQLQGVMAVGGDGLVHLIIQYLAHTNIPLLVFPAGTGNDFVRAQGFSLTHFDYILDYALNHPSTTIDLGNLGSQYFVDILSTGFDSIVNERANRISWLKGPAKYNLAIAYELPFFKPRNYQFTIDDKDFSTEAMLIAVANGNSYGGGMQVCPHASMTDGVFDIMILRPVSKAHFIKIFPRVFNGSHISDPAVEIRRGQHVSINADAIAYADGERIGSLPITADIEQGALATWIKN